MTVTGLRQHLQSRFLLVLGGVFRVLIALALASLASILLIRVVGGDVPLALQSLWDGAFGNPYNIGTTLVATTPLLLTGLGVGIAFRCKIWNIGGEGQFLVGCLLCSACALNFPWTKSLPEYILLPTILLASALAGALWALIAGLLKTWRSVPEVISTIMLNFISFELLSYMVNGPMERPDHSQPATAILGVTATLPTINALFPNVFVNTPLNVGFFLAIIFVGVTYVLLNMTASGFSMKVVGANPDAARLCGIPVNKTLLLAMALSGALCGLAGGVELSGNVGCIYEGYQPGYGFQAIAVALLGRLSPVGIFLSALFVGALSVGCQNMERTAGIAHETGLIIQALALLILLATQWTGWSVVILKQSKLFDKVARGAIEGRITR